MNFTKAKEATKIISKGVLFALIFFATLSGALAEDLTDAQVEAEIATLPDAGITPNSGILWNIEILGESIEERFLYATASKEKQNKFRLNRIDERLAELGTVSKDEVKAKKVMDDIVRHQNALYPIAGSEEEIKHSAIVIMAVKERLAAKGIEPKGLDVALSNQAKIYKVAKEKREIELPDIEVTDAWDIMLVEGELD